MESIQIIVDFVKIIFERVMSVVFSNENDLDFVVDNHAVTIHKCDFLRALCQPVYSSAEGRTSGNFSSFHKPLSSVYSQLLIHSKLQALQAHPCFL